jgi:hypothetical protein
MKKIYLFVLMMATITALNAQDEGAIVKKERFEFGQGIFLGGGPSFTLGKDIGDYSTGISFEAGYVKRLNRVLSIGPSISYINFKYDKKVTADDLSNIFIGGPYPGNNENYYYEGAIFQLKGGDLSLISLAVNLKLNLIPVTNTSVVSVYAFAKPFVSIASRTKIDAAIVTFYNYGDPYSSEDWADAYLNNSNEPFEWTPGLELDTDGDGVADTKVTDDLNKQSSVTGGIFVGPGIEFMPAKKVSIYLQTSIGYTLPVSFIDTKKYTNDENLGNDTDYFLQNGGEKYPTTKKGFSSINIQFGATFNF